MPEIKYNIGFTLEEFNELIALNDDEPVDEEFLQGLRKKLAAKRKQLRSRINRKAVA